MSLDDRLLDIIACPACHGSLEPRPGDGGDGELVCVACGLVYPVREGIPVLLVDEARRPGEAEG